MLGEGVGVGAGDDPQAVQRGCRQYVSPAAALAIVGPLLPFSSSPQVTTMFTDDRRRTPPSCLMAIGTLQRLGKCSCAA